MNNFKLIGDRAKNKDLRRVCWVLSLAKPGEVVDPALLAVQVGLDKTTTLFFLDFLVEVGALLEEPPVPPGEQQRRAA